MRFHPNRKTPSSAATTWADSYSPKKNTLGPVRTRAGTLVMLVCLAVMLGLMLAVTMPRAVFSQSVQLVKVDVVLVAQGYRASKLTGSTVVNDKNEKIGSLDDLIIAQNRSLFAVLQVGGFLGLGGRLVAVPYETLKIADDGKRIELPGASKDELKNLPEFKYRS
jgi:hypothetical protein